MLSTPRGRAAEVQLCVEGDGDIDPAALTAAVAAASQACPGARLVRRGRRWVDSGQPPPVRVADSEPGFDRFRLDSPLLRGRLDRPGALGCEVILVRGAPATVIFRVHHALMDGLGAMIWQAQVFRALRGEAVEGATTETTYAEVMSEAAAALGRELQPLPSKLPFDRPNLLGKPATRYRRSMFRRRVIAGTHPAATAKIARLVTAYGDGRGPVCVPVDARQHLPGLRTTVTASGLLRFPIGPDEDWNDVHATLLTAMNEYQYLIGEGPPDPLSLPAMRAIRNAVDQAGRKKGTCDAVAVVSHLGVVDLADFCAPGFEATGYYSLGSVNFPAEFNIVESQGKTELTVAWFDGPGVGERAEALLDWVAGQLSPPAHADWDGNRTDRDAPPATLTHLFAEQVGRTPDALAVSGPDGAAGARGQRADAARGARGRPGQRARDHAVSPGTHQPVGDPPLVDAGGDDRGRTAAPHHGGARQGAVRPGLPDPVPVGSHRDHDREHVARVRPGHRYRPGGAVRPPDGQQHGVPARRARPAGAAWRAWRGLRGRRAGRPRLPGQDGTPAALKEFLAGRLPGYMIPAVLIVVDGIPRNANGKTDVRRLPDPFADACDGTAAVPGRDDVTNAVARIWAQALQVDAHLIDEQTDFRQLGGNSILLLAMIEEVSKSVAGDGAEFMSELGRIIREPTLGRVSGLARQLRAGQAELS